MEIGSFIELDTRNTGEYYSDEINTARLNSARAGIYHACRLYGCHSLYLPYYLCPAVSKFLQIKGIEIFYYNLTDKFEPDHLLQEPNSAVVLVNYFGILSSPFFENLKIKYRNVIVDNCASFYSVPIENCYNVYSPRKFFGVPDGCYIIGDNAEHLIDEYPQDSSSATSLFLFKRIEVGSSAAYAERKKNEERIDHSDILQMSKLSRYLLSGIDYETIKQKRIGNFHFAQSLFKNINLFNPLIHFGSENVPMVYPLVIENIALEENLKKEKIYTGKWWKHVLSIVSENSFEAWLSKFMIPIPIDQRYGEKELLHIRNKIFSLI